MLKCPSCGETDPRIVGATEDARWLCAGCDTCWTPEDNPRLPLPPAERVRKDLE